ncbi:MAG: hypothetical protein BGP13_21935 [Sphingobacteriales bacterium 40-81]|nr:MAG: hypothetical protein BGP13_21935 [Sphingobacteriales bacterium 40-81]
MIVAGYIQIVNDDYTMAILPGTPWSLNAELCISWTLTEKHVKCCAERKKYFLFGLLCSSCWL